MKLSTTRAPICHVLKDRDCPVFFYRQRWQNVISNPGMRAGRNIDSAVQYEEDCKKQVTEHAWSCPECGPKEAS